MRLDDPAWIAELRGTWPPDRNYLIGVSGGRDSVALLHLLHGAGYENLTVCHLNHQLRGGESDGDTEFVRNLAEKYSCACEVQSTDVRTQAAERKLSIETAARQARHEFFWDATRKYNTAQVFLAHHADDQVETVLMNLCRGAGLKGIGGMEPEISISVFSGKPPIFLLRPFLRVRRKDIDDRVKQHDLKFREDRSNAEITESTRNRIRHELMPLLDDIFGRDTAESILRTSVLATDVSSALTSILTALLPNVIREDQLQAKTVLAEHTAIQRLIVQTWLQSQPKLPGVGFREIEAIREMLPPDAPVAKVNLPGGWHARRRDGRVFLQPPGD